MSKVAAPARGDARAAMLDAAERLFAARGLHDVTMTEVAEASGVARATVFNHFGSKHALVDAITAKVLAGYVVLLDAALEDRKSPTPVLVRSLFEAMGRGIEANERFYRAVFREIAKISQGLDVGGAATEVRAAALERLLRLHTRGQARGDLMRGPTAETLASAFDSLVFGTITHWLYEDRDEPLHERMLCAAEILLRGIAGESPRPARPTRAAARVKRRRP